MASGDIYLGASGSQVLLSAFGRKYTERITEFARTERTANGRLTKDIYADKREFTLDYELIDGDDLDALKTIYDLNTELLLTIHEDDSTTTDYIVLMDPIDYRRDQIKTTTYSGLWSSVTVILREV